MAAFFTSFAGGFLVAPLCGEPVLDVVGDPLRLLIFTALWYLMYYTPGDVIYTASKMLPVKTFLYVMKGLYYPKKIVAGIKHAGHVFHGNLIGKWQMGEFFFCEKYVMYQFFFQPTSLLLH